MKRAIGWGYPKFHTEEHFKLLADIIGESGKEYRRVFGNDNFYVVIFPGNPVTDSFKRMLKERNVKFIDYAHLTTIKDKMLPFDDSHPNPALYKIVGTQLSNDFNGGHPTAAD